MDRVFAIGAEEKGIGLDARSMINRRRKVGVPNFFLRQKQATESPQPVKENLPSCLDCIGEPVMIEENPKAREGCLQNCVLKSEKISSSPEVAIHRPFQKASQKLDDDVLMPDDCPIQVQPLCLDNKNGERNFYDFCKNNLECHRCSKPEILQWIGQHVAQVHNNTKNVSEKINAVFNQLIKACEERRNQLLQQVLEMEGKKIESLKRVHDACMSSEKLDNNFIENFCSLDFVGSFKVDDNLAPSKTATDSNEEVVGTSSLHEVNLGHKQLTSPDFEFKEKLDLMTFKFPTLEEGNLVFREEQSLSSKILSFGELNEALASPDLTSVSGLGVKYGFAGEEASFEVTALNKFGEPSILTTDLLNVRVFGPDSEELPCTVNQSIVSYTPITAGEHLIRVAVNGVEIPGNPMRCRIYEKESLVFDTEPLRKSSLEENGNTEVEDVFTSPTKGAKYDKPPQGLDTNLQDNDSSCADAENLPSVRESRSSSGSWILQKGETSALLSTVGDGGGLLYSSLAFQSGMHAWKVKVTSACLSVNLFIGVSAKTNNYDLDTECACNFGLKELPLQRTSQTYFSPQRRRKVSIFERYTVSFIVIADMAFREVKVINCSTMEVKLASIPLSYSAIYPTIFMAHECRKSVCPRPQVTFS